MLVQGGACQSWRIFLRHSVEVVVVVVVVVVVGDGAAAAGKDKGKGTWISIVHFL